jgi:hypothetical protein
LIFFELGLVLWCFLVLFWLKRKNIIFIV